MGNGMNSYLYRKMNRELAKMKYRALGSAALIVLSVAFYIGLAGMVPNSEKALEDKVETLHLNDYMVHVNKGNESQTTELDQLAGVKIVETRLQLSSRVFYNEDGQENDETASLFGIDPTLVPEINIPEIFENKGHYFQGNGSGQVLVERNFAQRAELEPGDNIMVQTGKGVLELEIIGLVFSPEYIMLPTNPNSLLPYPGNLAVLFVPTPWLREAFSLPGDFVNEFLFLFEKGQDEEKLQEEINTKLAGDIILYSVPKDDVYGYRLIKEDLKQGESFSAVFAFIILLVAFFIVYVTFARVVEEQRKEIGILRALGYSRRAVLGSYLYMALIMGLVGSLAGILIGIPFSKMMGEFYVKQVIGTSLSGFIVSWEAVIIGFFFGPVTACLASGIASWGTATMEPQDAIRGTPKNILKTQKKSAMKKLSSFLEKQGRILKQAQNGTVSTRKERAGAGSELFRRFQAKLKKNYILHYTLRNMWENRNRTSFTAVAVALSILVGALPLLMFASLENSINEGMEEYEKWDVIVEYAYPLNDSQASGINPGHITEKVYISRAQGSWEKGGKSDYALIVGISWNQTLHRFNKQKGRLPGGEGEAMVSEQFSEKNDIKVGDVLRLKTTDGNVPLRVTAVVSDVLGEVFVDMKSFEELTGELLYTGMYVKVEPGKAELVRGQFKASPQVSTAETRDGTKSGLLDLMTSYTSLIYVFSLLGVGIAAVTLANTVFIGVLERYPEYGQLRAIGYSKKIVRTSVLSELLVIIAVASVVGIPLTWLFLLGYEQEFKTFFPNYETILHLGDWTGYIFVVVLTIGMAILAALPSIRFINRMDIAKTVAGARFG